MGSEHLGSLHELVGAGRSRLSLIGAMRVRDVSRPTPEQLDASEARAATMIAARLGGRPRWHHTDGRLPLPSSASDDANDVPLPKPPTDRS